MRMKEKKEEEMPFNNLFVNEMILISKVMVNINFKVNIKKSYEEYKKNYTEGFFGKELYKNLPIMNSSVSRIDYNNIIFSIFVNFFSISI